jgi:site-specific DNA recombinase
MYRSLEARREALEAAESTPDAWREVPTGQSYRQFWDGLSTDHERNRALRDAGVRVVIRAKGNPVRTRPLFGDGDVHEGGRVELQIPGDLQARVRDSLGA